MRHVLWVFALQLFTTSSASAQANKPVLLPEDSVRHLSAPGLDGPPESVFTVLRTAAEWDSVWAIAHRNRITQAPQAAPAVDFTREMVLLAGLGTQSSTGWSIRIDTVVTRGDTMRVIIHSVGPQCVAGMAFTYAWDAVRVPRTNGPVQFIRRPMIDYCRRG